MVSSSSRLSLPLLAPENVIPHLGSPIHWKQGRSAKALADSWFQANGLPERVRQVLDQAAEFRGAELVDAWLEKCTDLNDGRATATQTDLLAVLGLGDRIAVLAVEGKVTESFDLTVDDWLKKGGTGKTDRLRRLCSLLGLDPEKVGPLRYQLFHRTAAAILEAKRYRTQSAILLVHSFCSQSTGFGDFKAFANCLGFEEIGIHQLSEPKSIGGVTLKVGWVSDLPLPGSSRRHRSVEWVNEFGRTRLSKNFFMRDFLFSDIAAVHGFSNIPENPELAIAAGSRLCEDLLEPIQKAFGRIEIRSAYRSAEVNGFGSKRAGYNCALNESNFASHIWDVRDAHGCMGATACIVVPSFWDRFQVEGDWRKLAWWIHDNLPYSELFFFPRLFAFNISWHERPVRRIDSYVHPKGCLTKPGMPNHAGSHEREWTEILQNTQP